MKHAVRTFILCMSTYQRTDNSVEMCLIPVKGINVPSHIIKEPNVIIVQNYI